MKHQQKNQGKLKWRGYAVSLVFAGVPLGLAVLFWLFALVVAIIKEGWLVFYGSVIFLYILSAIMMPCGIVAAICSLFAFRRRENRFRCTISLIGSFLTIALGALLATQML